ncbi:MAG: hypothetical protein PF961_13020, partial [Planctomycetota bacterium]|nr:hypothetical protein [Planctomycetota bacterium]
MTLADYLAPTNTALSFFACTHQATVRQDEASAPIADSASLSLAGATVSASCCVHTSPQGGQELHVRFCVESGSLSQASLGLRFDCSKWSTDNYLLMPAAVYNGNRYPRAPIDRKRGPEFKAHDIITVTPVPRLHPEGEPSEPSECNRWKTFFPGGPSQIQLLTGDCATPLMGLHFPTQQQGLIISTDQGTVLGNTGMSIFEDDDRSNAGIVIKAPGVREGVRYQGRPSTDTGAELSTGDVVEIRVVLHRFEAPAIPDLFSTFFAVRNELRGDARFRCDIPFGATFKVQERKHNASNWVEDEGYYSVGMREVTSQDWQTGWVGGPNSAYGLLVEGGPETIERVKREWDFIANGAQAPCGFLYGGYDSFNKKWNTNGCYLRYSGDTLTFLMKTILLLTERAPYFPIPDNWIRLARGLCDAFVRTFEREGRFVHHVNAKTGATEVGGSCAGGEGPGGLALAARYFDEPKYLDVAEGAARVYRDDFVAKGITNGGPGDIFQCIDSESAAAILDSFAMLYEETGKREWADAAEMVAHQCASYTMTYDYQFPADSTMGKLDALTVGTVWANIQNKHSAPGICTLSGDALLKLFRATGDRRYIDLCAEIAHAIPQYMSRNDRPIIDRRPGQRWPVMPEGWINERVNTSDWEVRGEPDEEIGVGEIFGGSCWAEGAMLLTTAELPGIYLQTDTGYCKVFDHVLVQVAKIEPDRIILAVTNPTAFDSEIKLFAERSTDTSTPMGPLAMT